MFARSFDFKNKNMKKEKILIFDTTLRDGEQAAPASLTVEQKCHIARQLASLKVDVIEAGFPISSPGDFQAVSKIAEEIKDGPIICGLARLVQKDIEVCADAVKRSKRPRIHTFIGTSAIHAEKKLRKSEDEILELVKKSVKLARNLCDDVEFSAEDAGRTDIEYLYRIVETAIKAGAKTINIPDTVGYTIPEQFGEIIDGIYKNVPNVGEAVISVHCHNDLGMATANSLIAVAHGARQVECTINGIGERAGNASLEEIVMAIKLRQDFFNVSTGIDTTKIMQTSKLVRNICNMPVQPNKAIVGANAFAHSSGIHQDGVLKERNTYEIMTPESVGLKTNSMNLTGRSGRHILKTRLADLGYAETEYDMDVFYGKFKELADQKGTVYDDDLMMLMEKLLGNKDVEHLYTLEYLEVSCGKGDGVVTKAKVRVKYSGDAVPLPEKEAAGNGAFDAAKKAIDEVFGGGITVVEFHLDAITGGSEAVGKVTIRASTAEEGLFVGTDSNTDIVVASANAYMDIVNKVEMVKKFKRNVIKGGNTGSEIVEANASQFAMMDTYAGD